MSPIDKQIKYRGKEINSSDIEEIRELKGFKGTCYKAANWIYLGMTKGIGTNSHHDTMYHPEP